MTTSPQKPPPGLAVDGFRLRARLGEGGMGVVHLGQRPGERPVALKVLRPHIIGDDEARQRLEREVGSLSRVRSRRVAEIVDADPWGDIPYVATRYVPGLSLHDHVREEGVLAGGDLLWFAECLAEALDAVHGVGVLHRDVKPSNVIMEGRTPILIDFGLARLADDPRITMTGWLLGTPGYLAPEILQGDDATAASDVHSWAATVAYAGTGRSPFGRGPSAAVMDRVRRGEHDLTGLDPVLLPLVEESLHPDPEQRPTLPELRDWLAELTGRPVEQAEALEPAPETIPITEFVSDEYVAGGQRVPLGERFRRSTLTLATGLVVTGAIAAAPYVTLAVLAVVVWLLRSGSLAASALGRRRELRGAKWYDSVLAVTAAPWHLVVAVGGSLLLLGWSLGIALAFGLLCFAAALAWTPSLAVMGFAFAVALWSGPGSSRLRSPVRRAVHASARRGVPWLISLLLVLAVASALGALTTTSGTQWWPDTDAPFAGVEVPSWL